MISSSLFFLLIICLVSHSVIPSLVLLNSLFSFFFSSRWWSQVFSSDSTVQDSVYEHMPILFVYHVFDVTKVRRNTKKEENTKRELEEEEEGKERKR